MSSFVLLLIRLYWGYQFVVTGVGKFLHFPRMVAYFQSLGIPAPSFFAAVVGSIELSCGSLLFLGLYSRFAAIPLFSVVFVAYLTAERPALSALFTRFDTATFFAATPFLFMYAVVLVFCFGPGKLSLDYWVKKYYKTKEMP